MEQKLIEDRIKSWEIDLGKSHRGFARSIFMDGYNLAKELYTMPPLAPSPAKAEQEGLSDIQSFYNDWCKETKRSGGVLIGSSIRELLQDFAAKLSTTPPVKEAGQPAPSGLRWVSCGKEMPPIEDWYDELPVFLFRGKGDDPRSGWVYVAYLNANEIREAAKGFDYCEWLSDSPAPVQVDPVNLAMWVFTKVTSWDKVDKTFLLKGEDCYRPLSELLEKYTQSLQK